MEADLHLCPHCGGEIDGMAFWYSEENKALHFEMDHGDLACHFDLEFSPIFLNMHFDRLLMIFQQIGERRADYGLLVEN
jgi:hypothetical protein